MMDTEFIYILDERTPSSQLEEQLQKTKPLTKEEVVDLIISKVGGRDEVNFKVFEKKYLKTSFANLSNQTKYNTFLEDLKNLENLYENLGSWIDLKELRSDLLSNLISFHFVEGKTVLYNYQIENWINSASEYHLLSRKKEYISQALLTLQGLIEKKIEFSDIYKINKQLNGTYNSLKGKSKRKDSEKKSQKNGMLCFI